MLNGDTKIIAHLGYPTTTFKSSMIYNPWFDSARDQRRRRAAWSESEDFGRAFPEICRFTNFHGALITMPHKVSVIGSHRRGLDRGEGRGLVQRSAPRTATAD